MQESSQPAQAIPSRFIGDVAALRKAERGLRVCTDLTAAAFGDVTVFITDACFELPPAGSFREAPSSDARPRSGRPGSQGTAARGALA